MLVHKQIKTLAKPYTDRLMTKITDCLALDPERTMWSNTNVIFFGETGPKLPPHGDEPGTLQSNNLESIREWCASPGVQVWPVEIGPYGGLILLRFIDQFGYSHWFDARYVSAIMKRHSDPDWYFNEGRLTARDSTLVTIAVDGVPAATLRKGGPIAILREWAWGRDMAAAVDNYRAWDPDWRLSNTSLETWHTLRWAQELDRVLPRGKKGSQFSSNGGAPARRAKVGKHKYIELAGESGRACVRISLENGEIADLTQIT